MTTVGDSAYLGESFGWRDELSARLRDLLSSRAIPSTERLTQAITRAVGRCTDVRSLCSAVRELLTGARERSAELDDLDADIEELCERIVAYRARESIENYGEYLFTVDIRL